MCGYYRHAVISRVLNPEIVAANVIVTNRGKNILVVVGYILGFVIIKYDRLSWNIAVRLRRSIVMTDLISLLSLFFPGIFT